jgi:hypothetical protein
MVEATGQHLTMQHHRRGAVPIRPHTKSTEQRGIETSILTFLSKKEGSERIRDVAVEV